MAALSFDRVRKAYDEVEALRDLTLDVADGEFVILVGPSGSGKTTALRAAAGLEQVTGGTIRIGDRDVTRLPPVERNVAMVFQSYALFPHLSVADNIGFGLRARRVRRDETAARVRAAAEAVGCDRFLERRPYQLSGGERQRVALARALVREPDVFLLDEPLSNLDAQLRVEMRAELKRLHQRLGATMLYVTHDQIEALTLGDRVAVLHEGVLQQVAPPDEIYRRPANRFVATFVGVPAMNVLDVRDGHAGPFPVDVPARAGGRLLQAGIRPEHLRVGDGGVPFRVDVVEEAGSEAFLHLARDGTALVVRVGEGVRPRVDELVPVALSPSEVRFFDADTGAAV